jgi:hypothetical protein
LVRGHKRCPTFLREKNRAHTEINTKKALEMSKVWLRKLKREIRGTYLNVEYMKEP